MPDAPKYRAYLVQNGHEVTLRIGSREECLEVVGLINGPGVTKLGVEKWRGEKKSDD